MKTIIKIARRLTKMPQTQDFSKLLSLDDVHFPFDQLLRKLLQCLRTILAILPHLIPSFQHQPLEPLLAFSASSGSPGIHPQITLQILCELPLFEANRGLTDQHFQRGEQPGRKKSLGALRRPRRT
jgi:hypothetical protein